MNIGVMSLSELLQFALMANVVSFVLGFIGEGLVECGECQRQRRIAELGKQLRTQTEQLKAQVLEDRIRREQAKFTQGGFDADTVEYEQANMFYGHQTRTVYMGNVAYVIDEEVPLKETEVTA